MTTIEYLHNKKGVIILYAAIISSIVLIVGVSLLNIISKQLNLSYITRSAKQATLTTWSGATCFDYWYVTTTDNTDYPDSFVGGGSFNIYCGNANATVSVNASDSGGIHYNRFYLSLNDDKSCVVVNSQTTSGGALSANSYGYNIGCAGLVIDSSNLSSIPTIRDDNPRVVQKILSVPIPGS
mgnify:CR=1 FL=1